MSDDQEYVARGTALRVARVRMGWTLAEAAARLGTSESHLSRIERGQRRVPAAMAVEMAAVYESAQRSILRSARGVELQPER